MNSLGFILLAAGRSTRMGQPKALMKLGQLTFLQRILSLYDGWTLPTAVILPPELGPQALPLQSTRIRILTNPIPERGPLSSLLIGLDWLAPKSISGIIVHPVDHPLVLPATVQALVRVHQRHPTSLLLPQSGERTGHPVVFPTSLFEALREAPLSVGARHVVQQYPERTRSVEVEDPGIHRNIDTPEDYRRWIEQVIGSAPSTEPPDNGLNDCPSTGYADSRTRSR